MSNYLALTDDNGMTKTGGFVASNLSIPDSGFGSHFSSLSGINFSGIDNDPLVVADKSGNLQTASEVLTFILPKELDITDPFYINFYPRSLVIQMAPTWRMRGLSSDSGIVFSFAGFTKFLRVKHQELMLEMKNGKKNSETELIEVSAVQIKKRYQTYKRYLLNGNISLSGLVLKDCDLSDFSAGLTNAKPGDGIPDDIFDYKWVLDDPFLVQMCFFDVGYLNSNGSNTILYEADRNSQLFKKMRETRKGQAVTIRGLTEANLNVTGKIYEGGRISMYLRLHKGKENYVYPEIRCGNTYGDFKDPTDLYGTIKTSAPALQYIIDPGDMNKITEQYPQVISKFSDVGSMIVNAGDKGSLAALLNSRFKVPNVTNDAYVNYYLKRYPCYYLGVIQQDQGKMNHPSEQQYDEDTTLEQYRDQASRLVIKYKM